MTSYENFNSEKYTYEGESEPVTSSSPTHPGSVFHDDDFRAHLAVFLVINGLLFLIDFLTRGGFWFQYVAISWGIGLSIHFWETLFQLHVNMPLKRDLLIHAAVEGTLIGFFFLMDYFTSPRLTWFLYPSLPLAFAWFCHCGAYLFRHPKSPNADENWRSPYNRMLLKEKFKLGKEDNVRIRYLARKIVLVKTSAGVHTFVFFAAVGFFLGINLFSNPRILWFYWPVLPWGLGYVIHLLAARFQVKRLRGKKVSKWYNIVYPGAVCVFLMAIDYFSDGLLTWFHYPTIPIMGITIFVLILVPQPKVQPILKPIDRIIKKFPHSPHPHQHHRRSPGIEVEVVIDNLNENEDTPTPKSTSRFCAKCGGPIEPGFQFCQYCGAKIR